MGNVLLGLKLCIRKYNYLNINGLNLIQKNMIFVSTVSELIEVRFQTEKPLQFLILWIRYVQMHDILSEILSQSYDCN